MSSDAEGSINDVQMDHDDIQDLDNDLDAILQDNEAQQASQENAAEGALIPEAEEVNEMAEENRNEDAEKKEVKPKRVVRNPQPKLNEQTIKGPRGIAVLEKYFERVKFKGKGYEEKDLNVIMKTYEYWCHRLFPKFPFDNCIQRLETLGKKRATQTHIKRIRYNLLLNENEENAIQSDNEDAISNDVANPENLDDPFEQLTDALPPLEEPQLTEEQLERIKLNRERAERIRQDKLRQKEENRSLVEQNLPLPGTSRYSQDASGKSLSSYKEHVEDEFLLEKVREKAREDVEESNLLPDTGEISTKSTAKNPKAKESDALRRIREKAALNIEKSNFLPSKKAINILEDSESDEALSRTGSQVSHSDGHVRKNAVFDSDSDSRESRINKKQSFKAKEQLIEGVQSDESQVSSQNSQNQRRANRKNSLPHSESDSHPESEGDSDRGGSKDLQKIKEKAIENAEKSNSLPDGSSSLSSEDENLSSSNRRGNRIRKKKYSRVVNEKTKSTEGRDILGRIEDKAAEDLENSNFLPDRSSLLSSNDEKLSNSYTRSRIRKNKYSRVVDKKIQSIEEGAILQRIKDKAAEDLEKSSFLPKNSSILSSDEDLSDKEQSQTRAGNKNRLSDTRKKYSTMAVKRKSTEEKDILQRLEDKAVENLEKSSFLPERSSIHFSDEYSSDNASSQPKTRNKSRLSGSSKKYSRTVDRKKQSTDLEKSSFPSNRSSILSSDEYLSDKEPIQTRTRNRSKLSDTSDSDKETFTVSVAPKKSSKQIGAASSDTEEGKTGNKDNSSQKKKHKKLNNRILESNSGLGQSVGSENVKINTEKDQGSGKMNVLGSDKVLEEEMSSGVKDLLSNKNSVAKESSFIEEVAKKPRNKIASEGLATSAPEHEDIGNKSRNKRFAILDNEEMEVIDEEMVSDNEDLAANKPSSKIELGKDQQSLTSGNKVAIRQKSRKTILDSDEEMEGVAENLTSSKENPTRNASEGETKFVEGKSSSTMETDAFEL